MRVYKGGGKVILGTWPMWQRDGNLGQLLHLPSAGVLPALCRQAESVVRAMGWPEEEHNLASRAAMAMVDVLQEAGRQGGHSFQTWGQLKTNTLSHLNCGVSCPPCLQHVWRWPDTRLTAVSEAGNIM